MRSAALNPDEPQAETRTLAQITKYFSVSISLPGPTNAGHQLPSGSESVVRAWQAAIRRNEGLGHPVQSSSIWSGRIQPQDFPNVPSLPLQQRQTLLSLLRLRQLRDGGQATGLFRTQSLQASRSGNMRPGRGSHRGLMSHERNDGRAEEPPRSRQNRPWRFWFRCVL